MKRRLTILSAVTALLISLPSGAQQSSEGNAVRLLPTGKEFYDELLSAVAAAQRQICLDYYSIGRDSISTTLLDLLAEKVAQGVEVYLITDGNGTRERLDKVTPDFFNDYRDKGENIMMFNPFNMGTPLPRNHKKVTVIDNEVAFVGGMNIDDINVKGHPVVGPFLDLSVRLEGPVTDLLLDDYIEDWKALTGDIIQKPGDPQEAGDIKIDVVSFKGKDSKPRVRDVYVKLIKEAKENIRLVNAYFMPSAPIRRALLKAARRGVRIDILMGENTDLPIVKKQPEIMASSLARNDNIFLHIYPGAFFHEKAISIDGEVLMAGSANLDLLSRLIDAELNVIIYDSGVTGDYNALFDAYLAACK